MPTEQGPASPEETTRDRILRNAVARFSKQSYDTTGLREIAADADVDVAWVHRSFGSKEKLFADCIRAAIEAEGLLSNPGPETIERLLIQVLRPREADEIRPIDIFVHSLSSPEGSRVIREVGMKHVIKPLASRSLHGSEIKTIMSLSTLFGFTIMRDVVGLTALTQANSEEIKRVLVQAIGAINRA